MLNWEWYSVVVAISSVISLSMLRERLLSQGRAGKSLIVVLGIAVVAYSVSTIGSIFPFLSEFTAIAADLCWITQASFILTSLANFLREDKPIYARYPVIFTYLPMIILPVYPFVLETVVIKEWVLALYQFGSICISALLLGLLVSREFKYVIVFIPWAIFTTVWFLKWLIEPLWFTETIRATVIAVGIIFFSKTFKDITHH
jgi:hypothetical protein